MNILRKYIPTSRLYVPMRCARRCCAAGYFENQLSRAETLARQKVISLDELDRRLFAARRLRRASRQPMRPSKRVRPKSPAATSPRR